MDWRRQLVAGVIAFFVVLGVVGEVKPSRAKLQKAEPEVRKATQELLEDLARGRVTRSEAAEAVRIMASQSIDPAEEYLLLQGAFRLLVRAGEYARAAEMLRHLRSREFPVEALVDLGERALEPVPRGVDTGALDGMLKDMRDDLARARRTAAETAMVQGLYSVHFPRVDPGTALAPTEFLDRVRGALGKAGKPGFRYVVRCPMADDGNPGFPVTAIGAVENTTLASALASFCRVGGYEDRIHGNLRFMTRTEPIDPTGPVRTVAFAGDEEATAQRMKRIHLGFVAFDENETVDEAIERLLLAIVDQGRPSDRIDFDVVLRSPPDGRFPKMCTLRAVDTTLYDILSLVCSTVGYGFKISGDWVLIGPR